MQRFSRQSLVIETSQTKINCRQSRNVTVDTLVLLTGMKHFFICIYVMVRLVRVFEIVVSVDYLILSFPLLTIFKHLIQMNVFYWHHRKGKPSFLIGCSWVLNQQTSTSGTLSRSILLFYHALVLLVFVVGFQYRSQVFNPLQPIFIVCSHCYFVTTLT